MVHVVTDGGGGIVRVGTWCGAAAVAVAREESHPRPVLILASMAGMRKGQEGMCQTAKKTPIWHVFRVLEGLAVVGYIVCHHGWWWRRRGWGWWLA